MLSAKELGVQVRPIFVNQVRGTVEADLGEPALSGLSPRAILAGVVEICNSGRCPVPQPLRFRVVSEKRSGTSEAAVPYQKQLRLILGHTP